MKIRYFSILMLAFLFSAFHSQAQTGPCFSSINYLQDIYCTTDPNPIPVITGNANGSFNAVSGLFLAPSTGEVILSISTPNPGNYYILQFHVVDAANSCDTTVIDSFMLVGPSSTSFSYGLDSICSNDSIPYGPVSLPIGGGTFSAPFGLQIDPATGIINPGGSVPGSYLVSFASNLPCFSPSNDTIVIVNCGTTSVPDAMDQEWSVFPVPAGELLQVQHSSRQVDAMMSLCDLQGRVVYAAQAGVANAWTLRVGELAAGMYILRIASEGKVQSMRVPVAR